MNSIASTVNNEDASNYSRFLSYGTAANYNNAEYKDTGLRYYLSDWKKYLNQDDYEYVLNYVRNITEDVTNDKILVLHGRGGGNRSEGLVGEIIDWIGRVNVMLVDDLDVVTFTTIVKMEQKLVVDDTREYHCTTRHQRHLKAFHSTGNKSVIINVLDPEDLSDDFLSVCRVVTINNID